MVGSNLKFGTGHNFLFSVKDHHGLCMVFCQKQAENRLLILTHNRKGLSLSFQKIIKLDQRYLTLNA